MINLGHRGYSAKYPENTMEAFKQAYFKGFDGIETDVQMTKDGVLVLIHDEKINRTSTGKGYVKDYTFKQLREFNFHNQSQGFYMIPSLQELLTFIKGKDFIVNLEIKTDVIEYPDIEIEEFDYDFDNVDNYDDIYTYVNEQTNKDLKSAFYMALGRERAGTYKQWLNYVDTSIKVNK